MVRFHDFWYQAGSWDREEGAVVCSSLQMMDPRRLMRAVYKKSRLKAGLSRNTPVIVPVLILGTPTKGSLTGPSHMTKRGKGGKPGSSILSSKAEIRGVLVN